MNYIKELNAFYDWLETNGLSLSGIALWHALMHINNKTAWMDEFAVAVSVLCVKSGLAPRTVSSARNELAQKGRIKWRQRKGSQAALYSIIPFYVEEKSVQKQASNAYKCTDKKTVDDLSASNADNHADNHAALNKLNETKLKDHNDHDREEESFVKVYEQEFGRLISPNEMENLQSYVDDGMEKSVVCEAIRRTRLQGKTRLSYTVTILNDWVDNQVTTMAGVVRVDAEFKKKKNGKTRASPTVIQQPASPKPSFEDDENYQFYLKTLGDRK